MTFEADAKVAGLSDIGQLRQVNEDSILVDPEARLYAIADGMGGHGSGDIASQLALETLKRCIASDSVSKALYSDHITDDQALALVFQCISGVNTQIYQENIKNGNDDGSGMGTTLVGLCFYGNAGRAVVFNIGDSRLYRFERGELSQLTQDHTMYRLWEEGGRIGPAPPHNLIVRAVGLFADVDIDLEVIATAEQASYLLCSDGLSGMVSDEHIARIMQNNEPPEALCQSLIDCANQNGGADNISVISLAGSKKIK